MAVVLTALTQRLSRRLFLKAASAVLPASLYAGEIDRHWIEITRREVALRGLPAAFDGMRIAQISDIHMDDSLSHLSSPCHPARQSRKTRRHLHDWRFRHRHVR